jgi:hypothetical protein
MNDYPLKRVPFTLYPGHTCCPDDADCPYNEVWCVMWRPRNPNHNALALTSAGDRLRPQRRLRK